MNVKLVLVVLTIYETAIIGLAQAEIVPNGIWEIVKDFPVLGLFLATLYYLMKWLDKMLEAQRLAQKEVYESNQLALKEVHESNQMFLSALLNQIETKQNRMSDRIELLTQQVALSTATLSEVVNFEDFVNRLMEKIQK